MSGTSRAIYAVILLCLSFLVSLVLQFWSQGFSKYNRPAKTNELLFHSNLDQLSYHLYVGVGVDNVLAPLNIIFSLNHIIIGAGAPFHRSYHKLSCCDLLAIQIGVGSQDHGQTLLVGKDGLNV